MSMSRKGLNIYKRKDGRWEARYIKSRTAQGKPLYGYLYASSYHEARNRLQDVIRLQGNAPNSKEMCKGSVFEFFSIEWLDTFSTNFKESTYIRYRTLIKCYLMPYFQTAKIENITKEHVLDFCKEIETHGKRDGTALSTKTVSDILSVLRRILHYAKAQNIPVDSAIFDIRIKQTPKPLPVLSLSEQLTLQKYLIGHPDCLNLGILLCLFTGIRIGELCALTWDKISLSERSLRAGRGAIGTSSTLRIPALGCAHRVSGMTVLVKLVGHFLSKILISSVSSGRRVSAFCICPV